jgi:hypothetical protein
VTTLGHKIMPALPSPAIRPKRRYADSGASYTGAFCIAVPTRRSRFRDRYNGEYYQF